MKPPFPPLAIVAVMLLWVLGLPFGLYALATRGRRRSIREIRVKAAEQGWRFRLRHWSGNPTAFRIDGRTHSGLDWVLKTIGVGTETYTPGWNAQLEVRFPMLAGKVDFAILPREADDRGTALLEPGLSPAVRAKVVAFSATLASAIEFFHDASQFLSGLPAFDTAYQVLALAQQFRHPLDAELAACILHWPEEAVAPHSVLVWRDPFGFHLQVRLPAPANWPTVSYSISLAEQIASRLPAPSMPTAPPSFVDRFVARLQK